DRLEAAPPDLTRRHAELGAERGGEVAVAGEADVQRDTGEIDPGVGQPLQRRPQPKPVAIAVHGQARVLPEGPAEVVDGEANRRRQLFEGLVPVVRARDLAAHGLDALAGLALAARGR